MSPTNQLTGPSASTIVRTASQEFAPEQLERMKSAINCFVSPSNSQNPPGAAIAEFLHAQDLMNARTGPITPVEQSSSVGFLDLPAEVRNNIYHHCLVVDKVFPRAMPFRDERFEYWKNYAKSQTQLFLLCKQVFSESAPIYFSQNQFVISHGPANEWPWARPDSLRGNPVSSFAYKNLKSLSISFDYRDMQYPVQQRGILHGDDLLVQSSLLSEWSIRQNKIMAMPLEALEICPDNCFCVTEDNCMVANAVEIMKSRFPPNTLVTFKWMVENGTWREALTEIDDKWTDIYDFKEVKPQWGNETLFSFRTPHNRHENTRRTNDGRVWHSYP
ncbi:hypothetical protein D6C98_07915 [Aureobasidium pullulans]|nr:hypothetical protein D6C98_07915 [Aureobasidium pullulans]